METILTIVSWIIGAMMLLFLFAPLLPIIVAIVVVGLLYLFWPLSGLLILVALIAAWIYSAIS
jgi:hypothetical protein